MTSWALITFPWSSKSILLQGVIPDSACDRRVLRILSVEYVTFWSLYCSSLTIFSVIRPGVVVDCIQSGLSPSEKNSVCYENLSWLIIKCPDVSDLSSDILNIVLDTSTKTIPRYPETLRYDEMVVAPIEWMRGIVLKPDLIDVFDHNNQLKSIPSSSCLLRLCIQEVWVFRICPSWCPHGSVDCFSFRLGQSWQ